MPTFSSAQVTDPFLSTNELLAPMLAHITAQEKLGNLDINRQELALKQDQAARDLAFGDYLKKSLSPDGVTGTTGAAGSTPFEQQMGFAEGGNSADKVNASGYAGQFQFGAGRLADLGLYTPAPGEDLKANQWKGKFNIAPYGVSTLQDFLANPAAQHAAFVTHVADIDKAIDATPGADRFDRNGLRAVAHLGGVGGMREFIAAGGDLNRHDSNGTSLKNYYTRFATGGPTALQAAFGSAHGSDGPPPAPPPQFNAYAGPRVAGAPPAAAPPGFAPVVPVPGAPTVTSAPPPPVQTSEAEDAPAVEPSRQAMRLGGPAAAGPAAGQTTVPPVEQPNRLYATGLPGIEIRGPGNPLAPPPVVTAAAPTAPAAAPPGATRPPLEAPPAAPSRVVPREPTIQSGIFAGLTRTQAQTIAQTAAAGAKPAQVMEQIATARHQNDVIRQGDATQAAEQQQQDYIRRRQFEQDQRQREQDQIQTQKDAEARVQREIENKRAEAGQQLSREGGGREAAKAHEEILNRISLKKKAGTATPEEEQLYAGSYYAMQQQGATPTTMDGPNGQKIPVLITRQIPKIFPEPEGGALPLVVQSPDAPSKAPTTEYQAKAGGYADRMQIAAPIMDKLDDASTYAQRGLERAGKYVGYSVNSPEYEQLRAAQKAFLGAILKKESGATITDSEFARDGAVYFPQPGESIETARLKQRFRQAAMEATIREAGEGYKPASSVAAPQTATPTTAPTNPAERKADTTYQTPKGPLKWTGTGWVAP